MLPLSGSGSFDLHRERRSNSRFPKHNRLINTQTLNESNSTKSISSLSLHSSSNNLLENTHSELPSMLPPLASDNREQFQQSQSQSTLYREHQSQRNKQEQSGRDLKSQTSLSIYMGSSSLTSLDETNSGSISRESATSLDVRHVTNEDESKAITIQRTDPLPMQESVYSTGLLASSLEELSVSYEKVLNILRTNDYSTISTGKAPRGVIQTHLDNMLDSAQNSFTLEVQGALPDYLNHSIRFHYTPKTYSFDLGVEHNRLGATLPDHMAGTTPWRNNPKDSYLERMQANEDRLMQVISCANGCASMIPSISQLPASIVDEGESAPVELGKIGLQFEGHLYYKYRALHEGKDNISVEVKPSMRLSNSQELLKGDQKASAAKYVEKPHLHRTPNTTAIVAKHAVDGLLTYYSHWQANVLACTELTENSSAGDDKNLEALATPSFVCACLNCARIPYGQSPLVIAKDRELISRIYLTLAVIKAKLGKHATAISQCIESLRHNPSDTAYNTVAFELCQIGRYRECKFWADQALQLNPMNDAAWANRACSSLYDKDQEGACADCRHALEQNPDNREARVNLLTAMSERAGLSKQVREQFQTRTFPTRTRTVDFGFEDTPQVVRPVSPDFSLGEQSLNLFSPKKANNNSSNNKKKSTDNNSIDRECLSIKIPDLDDIHQAERPKSAENKYSSARLALQPPHHMYEAAAKNGVAQQSQPWAREHVGQSVVATLQAIDVLHSACAALRLVHTWRQALHPSYFNDSTFLASVNEAVVYPVKSKGLTMLRPDLRNPAVDSRIDALEMHQRIPAWGAFTLFDLLLPMQMVADRVVAAIAVLADSNGLVSTVHHMEGNTTNTVIPCVVVAEDDGNVTFTPLSDSVVQKYLYQEKQFRNTREQENTNPAHTSLLKPLLDTVHMDVRRMVHGIPTLLSLTRLLDIARVVCGGMDVNEDHTHSLEPQVYQLTQLERMLPVNTVMQAKQGELSSSAAMSVIQDLIGSSETGSTIQECTVCNRVHDCPVYLALGSQLHASAVECSYIPLCAITPLQCTLHAGLSLIIKVLSKKASLQSTISLSHLFRISSIPLAAMLQSSTPYPSFVHVAVAPKVMEEMDAMSSPEMFTPSTKNKISTMSHSHNSSTELHSLLVNRALVTSSPVALASVAKLPLKEPQLHHAQCLTVRDDNILDCLLSPQAGQNLHKVLAQVQPKILQAKQFAKSPLLNTAAVMMNPLSILTSTCKTVQPEDSFLHPTMLPQYFAIVTNNYPLFMELLDASIVSLLQDVRCSAKHTANTQKSVYLNMITPAEVHFLDYTVLFAAMQDHSDLATTDGSTMSMISPLHSAQSPGRQFHFDNAKLPPLQGVGLSGISSPSHFGITPLASPESQLSPNLGNNRGVSISISGYNAQSKDTISAAEAIPALQRSVMNIKRLLPSSDQEGFSSTQEVCTLLIKQVSVLAVETSVICEVIQQELQDFQLSTQNRRKRDLQLPLPSIESESIDFTLPLAISRKEYYRLDDALRMQKVAIMDRCLELSAGGCRVCTAKQTKCNCSTELQSILGLCSAARTLNKYTDSPNQRVSLSLLINDAFPAFCGLFYQASAHDVYEYIVKQQTQMIHTYSQMQGDLRGKRKPKNRQMGTSKQDLYTPSANRPSFFRSESSGSISSGKSIVEKPKNLLIYALFDSNPLAWAAFLPPVVNPKHRSVYLGLQALSTTPNNRAWLQALTHRMYLSLQTIISVPYPQSMLQPQEAGQRQSKPKQVPASVFSNIALNVVHTIVLTKLYGSEHRGALSWMQNILQTIRATSPNIAILVSTSMDRLSKTYAYAAELSKVVSCIYASESKEERASNIQSQRQQLLRMRSDTDLVHTYNTQRDRQTHILPFPSIVPVLPESGPFPLSDQMQHVLQPLRDQYYQLSMTRGDVGSIGESTMQVMGDNARRAQVTAELDKTLNLYGYSQSSRHGVIDVQEKERNLVDSTVLLQCKLGVLHSDETNTNEDADQTLASRQEASKTGNTRKKKRKNSNKKNSDGNNAQNTVKAKDFHSWLLRKPELPTTLKAVPLPFSRASLLQSPANNLIVLHSVVPPKFPLIKQLLHSQTFRIYPSTETIADTFHNVTTALQTKQAANPNASSSNLFVPAATQGGSGAQSVTQNVPQAPKDANIDFFSVHACLSALSTSSRTRLLSSTPQQRVAVLSRANQLGLRLKNQKAARQTVLLCAVGGVISLIEQMAAKDTFQLYAGYYSKQQAVLKSTDTKDIKTCTCSCKESVSLNSAICGCVHGTQKEDTAGAYSMAERMVSWWSEVDIEFICQVMSTHSYQPTDDFVLVNTNTQEEEHTEEHEPCHCGACSTHQSDALNLVLTTLMQVKQPISSVASNQNPGTNLETLDEDHNAAITSDVLDLESCPTDIFGFSPVLLHTFLDARSSRKKSGANAQQLDQATVNLFKHVRMSKKNIQILSCLCSQLETMSEQHKQVNNTYIEHFVRLLHSAQRAILEKDKFLSHHVHQSWCMNDFTTHLHRVYSEYAPEQQALHIAGVSIPTNQVTSILSCVQPLLVHLQLGQDANMLSQLQGSVESHIRRNTQFLDSLSGKIGEDGCDPDRDSMQLESQHHVLEQYTHAISVLTSLCPPSSFGSALFHKQMDSRKMSLLRKTALSLLNYASLSRATGTVQTKSAQLATLYDLSEEMGSCISCLINPTNDQATKEGIVLPSVRTAPQFKTSNVFAVTHVTPTTRLSDMLKFVACSVAPELHDLLTSVIRCFIVAEETNRGWMTAFLAAEYWVYTAESYCQIHQRNQQHNKLNSKDDQVLAVAGIARVAGRYAEKERDTFQSSIQLPPVLVLPTMHPSFTQVLLAKIPAMLSTNTTLYNALPARSTVSVNFHKCYSTIVSDCSIPCRSLGLQQGVYPSIHGYIYTDQVLEIIKARLARPRQRGKHTHNAAGKVKDEVVYPCYLSSTETLRKRQILTSIDEEPQLAGLDLQWTTTIGGASKAVPVVTDTGLQSRGETTTGTSSLVMGAPVAPMVSVLHVLVHHLPQLENALHIPVLHSQPVDRPLITWKSVLESIVTLQQCLELQLYIRASTLQLLSTHHTFVTSVETITQATQTFLALREKGADPVKNHCSMLELTSHKPYTGITAIESLLKSTNEDVTLWKVQLHPDSLIHKGVARSVAKYQGDLVGDITRTTLLQTTQLLTRNIAECANVAGYQSKQSDAPDTHTAQSEEEIPDLTGPKSTESIVMFEAIVNGTGVNHLGMSLFDSRGQQVTAHNSAGKSIKTSTYSKARDDELTIMGLVDSRGKILSLPSGSDDTSGSEVYTIVSERTGVNRNQWQYEHKLVLQRLREWQEKIQVLEVELQSDQKAFAQEEGKAINSGIPSTLNVDRANEFYTLYVSTYLGDGEHQDQVFVYPQQLHLEVLAGQLPDSFAQRAKHIFQARRAMQAAAEAMKTASQDEVHVDLELGMTKPHIMPLENAYYSTVQRQNTITRRKLGQKHQHHPPITASQPGVSTVLLGETRVLTPRVTQQSHPSKMISSPRFHRSRLHIPVSSNLSNGSHCDNAANRMELLTVGVNKPIRTAVTIAHNTSVHFSPDTLQRHAQQSIMKETALPKHGNMTENHRYGSYTSKTLSPAFKPLATDEALALSMISQLDVSAHMHVSIENLDGLEEEDQFLSVAERLNITLPPPPSMLPHSVLNGSTNYSPMYALPFHHNNQPNLHIDIDLPKASPEPRYDHRPEHGSFDRSHMSNTPSKHRSVNLMPKLSRFNSSKSNLEGYYNVDQHTKTNQLAGNMQYGTHSPSSSSSMTSHQHHTRHSNFNSNLNSTTHSVSGSPASQSPLAASLAFFGNPSSYEDSTHSLPASGTQTPSMFPRYEHLQAVEMEDPSAMSVHMTSFGISTPNDSQYDIHPLASPRRFVNSALDQQSNGSTAKLEDEVDELDNIQIILFKNKQENKRK